jgi:hypothetical protein
MEQVEHITFGNKSAQAARDIAFGRIVQRHSAGKIEEFGGLTLDNMQTAWTPEANVTVTLINPSPIDGICNKIALAGAFTTGLAASRNTVDPATGLAWNLSGYAAVGFFIKSSIAQAAGDLQIGVSETADMGGSPVYQDVPALVANVWKYCSVNFSGIGTARDAIVSVGLNVVTDNGACDIYIDTIGVGALFNGIAGMSAMEEIVLRSGTAETYTEDSAVLVITAGQANATLAAGITCVAEQRLFPIPGGKLTTTEVTMPGRAIYAVADQATAGGRAEVIF